MLKHDTCGCFFGTMFVAGAALLAYTLAFELPAQAFSEGTDQAHDFNDGFYRKNGLDPKSPDFRRRFEDVKGKPFLPFSKKTNTKDPTRSKTRVVLRVGSSVSVKTVCTPLGSPSISKRLLKSGLVGSRPFWM